MVKSQCPKCSKGLLLDAAHGGKNIRCPHCKHVFMFTSPAQTPAAAFTAKAPAARRPAAASRPGPASLPMAIDIPESVEDNKPPQRAGAKKKRMLGLFIALGSALALFAVVMIALVAAGIWYFATRTVSNDAGPQANVQKPVVKAPVVVPNPGGNENKKPTPDAGQNEPPQNEPVQKAPVQLLPVENPVGLDNLKANDLVYDKSRGLLYAAIAPSSGQHANEVVAIDPATGKVAWSVEVGSDPAVMAISDNGEALWLGLRGAPSLQRVDLKKRTAGPLLPIEANRSRPCFVEDMEVMPGTTDCVVASLYAKGISPRHQGVAVFDNGVCRAQKTRDHTGANRIVRSEDPNVYFGYNNESTEYGLRRLEVDQGGITQTENRRSVITGFRVDIAFAGGRIYSTAGQVVDAKTLGLAGSLPINARDKFGASSIAVDPAKNRLYRLAQRSRTIQVFDTKRFTVKSTYTVETRSTIQGSLVLIGNTGLAFRTEQAIMIIPVKDLERNP